MILEKSIFHEDYFALKDFYSFICFLVVNIIPNWIFCSSEVENLQYFSKLSEKK